jgi:amino acid adenylation domain-containing protein/non-ribosomal peptide synthase protein (TIGR01720 family)
MSLTDRISALTPEQRALFEKLREKQRKAASAPKASPIPRVTGPTAEGDWPLSLDQERYWFMEQLYPEGAGLNVAAATRMRGPLSPPVVAAALTEIARRHAGWRTVFPVFEGRPVQRVLAPRPQPLQYVDLSGLPEERREAEALRLVGEATAAPFDLASGPLVRSALVRLRGEEHLCLLIIHHLVTDFLSNNIAWAELGALYGAFATGVEGGLPEPPVQYPDFAVWQRQWLEGGAQEELAAWWREQLAGFPLVLDLPTDRPRPAEMRMRGGRLTFAFDAALAERMRGLARQEGATLFMLVLAATAALLHRDSGQERLILGANNANRNRPEIEPVLGCFVTQVPFPLDLAGDPPFRELLARARRSALGAYAHQDLPFGPLVQALRIERDPGRQPLIQALVQVLDGHTTQGQPLAGISTEVVDAWDGRARYDLMLILFEVAGGRLEGALEYDADLFDPATAARRVRRFLRQVAAAVADPDLPLSALPVLDPAERHQALAEWNDTARPAAGWTAPERFAVQAARAPGAPAVTAAGETLSYRELDRRSDALARYLRGLGVGRESRVALLLGRTVDVPVAILGVWKAGGAYVPLDLDSPPERLASLLDDAAPAVVVHRGPLPVALPEGKVPLDLDRLPGSLEGEPLPEVRPGDLAYLIYTSGTTGKPKAVMVEHGSLAVTLASVLDLFGLAPGDRMPMLSRYTFDASFMDLVAPLVAGGEVEILSADEVLDPERLLPAFARATVVSTVPALLRRVTALARELGPEPFAGLRRIVVGSDRVSPQLQAETLAAFPATSLEILYGPTEAAVICAAQPVSRRRAPERALIGRPLPEVELRVVDPRGEPVPLGLPGELWIGGPGVARGYFRRDELTAERFVTAAGRRFYRSGDLVRQVPAEGGALEFLGRTDLQVKVRGFRIEPGEVEAALRAHPAVRDTVVVAAPGAGGDNQLVAYVVGEGLDAELRAFLRARLPEHMVPSLFVPLAALPLGPTDKVDRKALPSPRAAVDELAGFAPPRDAREETLAAIWREVLGRERVGIHDNFFQLGGDSILSIQIVARARREGLLITPRQLFENQTVAGLAAVAGQGVETEEPAGGAPTGFALAGLDREALDRLTGGDPGVEDLYPLAPLQEGLLFHSLYTAGADLYVEQLTAEIAGPLDGAAFAAAWQRVVERHPALRTAFLWQGVERPLQLVRRGVALPWKVEDWRGMPLAAREERWRDLLAADRARGFDLGRPPLLRLTLARLDEETHRLLWSFHHLLFDGWCFSLLLTEVFTLYQAAAAGREAHLPPPPRPFRDYIAWLLRRDEAEAEGFWRRRLRGLAASTPVPFDHSLGIEGDRADDYHERTVLLPAALTAGLEALAQRLRVTLNTLVQGAWALLLSRYAQDPDVVFGVVVSGRPPELAGVESMVGLFINTLPARVEVPEGEPLSAWLPRLQADQLEMRQHEWLPLARVQSLSEVPPGEPLLTSLLAFENYPVDPAVAERLGELRIVDLAVAERTNYPLTLTAVARGPLSLRLTALRRFEPATARRLLAHLENLLGALAADPERPARELPLLAAAERHQLTAEWNDTAAAYPDGASIPALFAEQAARRPDAPALLGPAPGAVLTYRELDERSAALAAELARQGVRRGDLVGLFAERSPELVIAILAVLRAGGAYLPLDPSYPRERLSLMLADAGDPLVLAQEGLAGLPARTLPLMLGETKGLQGQQGLQRLSGGDLAYVLYTSGSTGTPKGVAVSHRSVVRLVWGTGYASFGPDEVFLMMAPVSFDASTFELWGPLLNGGRLAILPPGEVSLDGLERAVRDFGVTTLWLTAGLFHLVVDERPSALAPLRQLLAGGDVLSPPHVARLRRELPALRLIDGYGPTENTTFTACGEVGEGEPGAAIPLGRPIANTRVLVLGRDLEPVPVGVPGELYAGGDGLALGYLGRPDLTAAAFVPAPSGERLYRTGDLVRRLPDGRLDFLGRIDDQVKMRGFRIEPGEIEAALTQQPGVREAVVLARSVRSDGSDRSLVAFAVPRGEARDTGAVMAHLASRLPAWMVPSALIWLEALPLSPTGKVDRAALLRRAAEREEEADLTAPRNAAEEILAAVWRQVLGLERVGVHDSFFRLGGDSILSIQVVARARQAGLVVTPRQVFEEQTIAALAAVAAPLAVAGEEAEEVSGETPLTPVQRYFLAAGPADPHHFNQSLLLRPAAPLVPAPLGRALTALVAHHDALRLRVEDGRRAWIAPREEGSPLLTLDLAALPPERRAGALEAAATALQAGFDLARGPLFRAAHFLLGGDERLFLVAHHLVVDGVSWRILLDDLRTVYQGSPLPARTTYWKRWAERLADYAGSAEIRSELPYWLAGAATPLPSDGTEAGPGFTTALLGRQATRALLGEAPAAYATQVNDLLLAALVLAFARWTGEPCLRFDLEGHGREEIAPDLDLSRTVGWFTTIFPVTLAAPPDAGPGDLIRGVKEALRAVPRRGLGYGLLRYLEEAPELAAIPGPEVAFNYLGQLDAALGGPSGWELAQESTGPGQSSRQGLRHAVEVNAWVLGGELRVSWSYDRSRLSPATAERLAEGYVEALAALVAHCVSPRAGGRTPSDFPLARLDPRALDALTGTGAAFDSAIEDLYPLAPLQEGMLFQGLLAPESELYFEHLTAELAGPLDAGAFARAWQAVVDRHPALRTAFAWEGLERPLQVVRRGVELPWTEEDWRGVPRAEQPARLAAWLAADRARPFDLARPPLMRGALLRTAEDRHRFVWSFHHLLLDGWCFSLLFQDVFAFYQATTAGRAAVLPPVRPYRDFIAWVARQDADAAERYFRRTLAGFTAATPLPLDRPALPPGDDGGPRDLDLRLSPALVEGLDHLARRRDLTLNTLVQGAWGLVLACFAGSAGDPDVVFGSVVSGRPAELPGVESMVGLFINTLPVRLAADPKAPVDGWLAEVQERLLEVRQHETAALAQVQRASEVPPGEPLFQSLVAFENYPVDESLGEGAEALAVTEVTVSDRTDYPLSLAVMPGRRSRSELTLRLSHDRRTDAATAHRLLLHMERLLAGFAEGSGRLLGDLPLLSAAERHQLTLEWNNRPEEAGIDLLHALAPAQDPAAVAIIEDGGEITYGELERRANRLARHLIALGVRPETRVALLAERSAEDVVAISGVLKAGGVWVPVDPETPAERAAFLLADSRPALVLALGEEMARRLPETAVPVVSLDAERERIAARSAEPPAVAVDPANLAYVIYTSGSTGTPKGVAVSHRSAAAYARTAARVYGLGAGDRVLHHYSLAFDMSVQEIFATLAGGAAIAPHSGPIEEPARFLAECEARGITAFDIPAAYWHQIAAAVESGGLRLPPSLRLIVTGGERPLAERWTAWSGGARLINAYGPTETTIGATFHERPETPDPLAGRREVPLGRLMAGMRAHVVDRDLRPVPAGGLGELILGGTGVARGYLGRPDLTAERFVPDGLSGAPGERLYRSGDLVRLLADGSLEFAGRIDGQVKVRGFRVELGEVEAVLASHPGLREAAVAVRPGGDALLAALVPADPASPPDLEALRSFLAGRLPAYMVPTAWAVLDALPLTPNGKLDRRALGRLEIAREAHGTPPSTPAEKAMADLWRQVLGVADPRLEDDFFALGGHSLLATQLATRVRAAFGVELPLRRLFESPRLGDLTNALSRKTTAGTSAAPSLSIPRRPAGLDPIPASFAQERLWFLDRVEPGNPAYNMFDALRAGGELSPALLAAALGEVVRRHEALRTTFAERAGKPAQVIAPPPARWPLPVVDLAALPEAARSLEAGRLAAAEAVRPFDLARGPLLRSLLVRLGTADHALLLAMHHVVSDGWSMGVLVHEVTALYEAALTGRPSPLPEPPIQYADFAVWQRRWLAGDELERQLSYWRRRLAGAPAGIDLPFDRPRPARPTYRGAPVDALVGPEAVEGLRRLARGGEATLFMVLLAAFQTFLRRITGQRDLPLGSPIANRNRAEVEPLIGFFVNMLVLRGEVEGDPPFPDLLARVRDETLEAYAHQDLPLDRLVEELRPERSLALHPLFQVICVLQNAPIGAVELPGLTFSSLTPAVTATRFDLELQAVELPGGALSAAFIYSTDLFDAATAARLSGAWKVLLQGLAEDPSQRISELPLLRPEELHQLIAEWNPVPAEAPAPRCLHRRFEDQADRAAGAPAVSVAGAAGAPLTYGELERQANRLAHCLQARGVRPGDRVALLLERSAEMVVAILGVLKAGAAYVPIDPAYPADRVSFVREDSGAALLLTAEDLEALDSYPTERLDLPLDPELPAYVIYTSGSTGTPKGVVVTHANVDRLFTATDPWFGFGPEDVWTLFHSYAFDFSVWELWGALRYGGRLLVLSFLESRDPEGFHRLLRDERVTVLNQTPSAFRQLVRASEGKPAAPSLRYVIFGGEALEPAVLAPWLARYGDQRPRLINMYGITETTVHVTYRPLGEADLTAGSRIGVPIPDLSVHLLDAFLRPAPVGVPGEIHVGGAGLAQGYLDRPALTAERFVPDPFSGAPGARLYRSGDLARRRPDGDLEYLGRIDHQVKLRGYRIELGEVESALARHPQVREAVVLLRQDEGEDRLVAYVVPREERAIGDEAGQVAQWQSLYDETYGRGLPVESGADPTFNLQGWNSSYTGEPIPTGEMREWVEGTVERLLALEHRRVLEVGCGTGLLLFRVAPHAERYRGVDFSPVALAQVRAGLDRLPLPQVELARGAADDWSGVQPGDFDLVVLNSVVQYFPDVDYLVRVLERAVAAVAPGGAVFVGDVRSLPLLPAFHASVQLHQSPGSLPAAELGGQVHRRVLDEEELVLDPGLFLALARRLPAVRRVQMRMQRGRHANELTRFRYDVVLHVGTGADGERTETDGHPWASLGEVERLLGEGPAVLGVLGIPNGRLASEAVALELLESEEFETVEELREEIARRAREHPGVDPEDLWALADRLGYDADLAPSGPDGRFEALFRRRGAGVPAGVAPGEGPELPWSAWANDPLRAGQERRLVPELRRFLEAELPEPMVPSAFVLLEALPLNVNGKVDRTALPAPERLGAPAGEWVAPATPLEEVVTRVAAEVLGAGRVGLRDSFFALGGHSLLATQLVSRLTQQHGLPVTLQMVFDAADLGGLADRIVEAELAGADAGLLDEALREMEGLSPEEVQELLGSAGLEEEIRE